MIVVDVDVLEISDDKNKCYEWKIKLLKYVTYARTYNFTYKDTHENTVASESCDKKNSILIQKRYFYVVTDIISISMCNIGSNFNTQSQSRKQEYL